MKDFKLRYATCAIALLFSLCVSESIRSDSAADDVQKLLDKSIEGLDGVFVFASGQEKEALAPQGVTNDWCRQVVELRLRRNGIKVLSQEEFLKAPGMPSLCVCVNTLAQNADAGVYSASIAIRLVQRVALVRNPQTVVPATT
jgi:hypothetical protein